MDLRSPLHYDLGCFISFSKARSHNEFTNISSYPKVMSSVSISNQLQFNSISIKVLFYTCLLLCKILWAKLQHWPLFFLPFESQGGLQNSVPSVLVELTMCKFASSVNSAHSAVLHANEGVSGSIT